MEQKNVKEWPLHKSAPKDFPKGFMNRGGMYYKTDKTGHVIEVRNIFGCDITSWLVDPDEVRTCPVFPRVKQERYLVTLKREHGGKEGHFIYKRDNETKEEKWLEVSLEVWDSLYRETSWSKIKQRASEILEQHGL